MSLWLLLKKTVFVGHNVSIGRNFHVGAFTWINATDRLVIGDDVLIGKLCTIQCNGRIGDGVLIANNVGVIGKIDHDFRTVGVLVRKTVHISERPEIQKDPRSQIDIGSDVWIGFGSTILSGLSIGRGAIVAAGSVVMGNVAPYDVVAGNPARPVGRRFTAEQIADHEAAIEKARTSENISGRVGQQPAFQSRLARLWPFGHVN
jgi:acetyltransferase-like isoleucine patch superfamily enzyme